MSQTIRLLALALLLALAVTSMAQRDDSRGGRTMTPDEIKQRIARSEGLLANIDANHNGVIDPEEAQGQQRPWVERILGRAGLEPKFPMPISQVRERLAAAYQNGSAYARPSGSPGGSSTAKPGQPAPSAGSPGLTAPTGVLGFGNAPVMPSGVSPVPGFGPPAAPAGSAQAGRPTAQVQPVGPQVALAPEVAAKIRELASSIIQKFDREKKGKLTREEWPSAPWGTFDQANRQRGNFITIEELVTHLADLHRQNSLYLDIPGTTGVSVNGTRSGRFLSPVERLPKGLPAWFPTRDQDGDGQVIMAEFTTDWTDSKLEEFDRYDLNDDGIIMPEECLKLEKVERGEHSEHRHH